MEMLSLLSRHTSNNYESVQHVPFHIVRALYTTLQNQVERENSKDGGGKPAGVPANFRVPEIKIPEIRVPKI
jgi:hypothetical protein